MKRQDPDVGTIKRVFSDYTPPPPPPKWWRPLHELLRDALKYEELGDFDVRDRILTVLRDRIDEQLKTDKP